MSTTILKILKHLQTGGGTALTITNGINQRIDSTSAGLSTALQRGYVAKTSCRPATWTITQKGLDYLAHDRLLSESETGQQDPKHYSNNFLTAKTLSKFSAQVLWQLWTEPKTSFHIRNLLNKRASEITKSLARFYREGFIDLVGLDAETGLFKYITSDSGKQLLKESSHYSELSCHANPADNIVKSGKHSVYSLPVYVPPVAASVRAGADDHKQFKSRGF